MVSLAPADSDSLYKKSLHEIKIIRSKKTTSTSLDLDDIQVDLQRHNSLRAV